MKKKLLLLTSYILVATLSAGTALLLFGSREGTVPKLERLAGLIQERFIGEADLEQLQDAAADAMVSATGDRWSYYISAADYASYQEQMANAYVGVGITIQQDEDGFLVVTVTPGGPAEEAGLQAGDLLIEAAGKDLREMTTTQVRELVRGEEGTTVTLGVLRKGEWMSFQVERRQVQTVVATFEMLPEGVGLVTIENFDARCADETIAAIDALLQSGAEKLIFDVRNNPGGYASELVEVLDYLLPEGEVFHTVTYDGTEDIDYSDAACVEVPMAVLVNDSSYSAAEFFAAALQEYEAAVVVGEQTVGKGYFQTTYQLGDGSAVALSIGEYFTPSGKNLAGVGVTPDVAVELDEETADELYYGTLSPQDDPQIQAAIAAME